MFAIRGLRRPRAARGVDERRGHFSGKKAETHRLGRTMAGGHASHNATLLVAAKGRSRDPRGARRYRWSAWKVGRDRKSDSLHSQSRATSIALPLAAEVEVRTQHWLS